MISRECWPLTFENSFFVFSRVSIPLHLSLACSFMDSRHNPGHWNGPQKPVPLKVHGWGERVPGYSSERHAGLEKVTADNGVGIMDCVGQLANNGTIAVDPISPQCSTAFISKLCSIWTAARVLETWPWVSLTTPICIRKCFTIRGFTWGLSIISRATIL